MNDQEIAQAVKDYLLSSRNFDSAGHDSKKEKKFYLSDMGKCMRMRWLKRKGVKSEFAEEDDYVNWIFAIGDMYHNYVYKALEAQGRLISSEEACSNEHFSWRYDGIVKDSEGKAMMDVKSAGAWQIGQIVAGGEKEENIAQVLGELMFLKDMGRDDLVKAVLIYVNKEPGAKRKEMFVQKSFYLTKPREEKLREEVKTITDYWLNDQIPPCTCPAWMKPYNAFQPLCSASEGQIKTILKALKDKDIVTTKTALYVQNQDGTERNLLTL